VERSCRLLPGERLLALLHGQPAELGERTELLAGGLVCSAAAMKEGVTLRSTASNTEQRKENPSAMSP
jgi:hypothetical protein